MISSLLIEGYRGLERFEMSDLGRINLLVGTNNSGKTSVLEAIYLLSSAGDPSSLWQLLWRRGERLLLPTPSPERLVRRSPMELDVSHIFYGHEAQPGSRTQITATNQSPQRSVEYTIVEGAREQQEIFAADEEGTLGSVFALKIAGLPRPNIQEIPLSRNGGIYLDAIDLALRRARLKITEQTAAQFITTESFSGDELVAMWNRVALTPFEPLVLQALQFLDPNIERLAAQASNQSYSSSARGGFIVKRRGWEYPVPIGSMGDGMWRMLAMAIAITQCKGGVLLVDEIDTGLHYRVMAQMWKLIFNAAREFDVQVFATTHSYDCVDALAQICSHRESGDTVTVQRIEPGRHAAIPYDEDEISVAARREIEVR